MNVTDFKKMKDNNQKISMVTCYDFWSAQLIANTDIDCLLVGDSLAMVMHGHQTTIPATTDMIANHVKAVVKGAKEKFIIADMPFISYRKSLDITMNNVETLMHAGCHAIKLEGVEGSEQIIKHIVDSGVPVMGHLGLTPQSVHQLGGYRVQGRESEAQTQLIEQAKKLESLGAFSLVLECVPANVAQTVCQELSIPVIGIGAGSNVDGQVLVLQDLLGLNDGFKPKFVKTYLEGSKLIKQALNDYNHDVKQQAFPNENYCFQE